MLHCITPIGAKSTALAVELTLFSSIWDKLKVYRFSAEIYRQTKFTGKKLNLLIYFESKHINNEQTRHIQDAP